MPDIMVQDCIKRHAAWKVEERAEIGVQLTTS